MTEFHVTVRHGDAVVARVVVDNPSRPKSAADEATRAARRRVKQAERAAKMRDKLVS